MPSDLSSRQVNDNQNDLRIWSVLDKMDKRLYSIENTLVNLVRLDERVNNHDKLIDRLSNLAEDHDKRLRHTELGFNNIGNREGSNSNAVNNLSNSVENLKSDIAELTTKVETEMAKKRILAPMLTWVFGIISAYVVMKMKGN